MTPPQKNNAAKKPFELGLYSFVELTPDPYTGELLTPADRLAQELERIELAEQVGLNVYAIGEHHRPDFVSSAPAVILAAAAARTQKIRLSSAVTVLSSDDPVRVFQQFATLDLLSSGRAEIMAGRGSFIESFPLFGYDLSDYNELFAEKLELLLNIRASDYVSWSGELRPPLNHLGVFPRPVQNPLPVWIAVGGTPESVIRAGTLGLPLALAIIGGRPEQFGPLADLYRRVLDHYEHGHRPLSINSHGFIADDQKAALETAYPPFKQVMDKIGRERGWPPMTRTQFEGSAELRGANFIGGPDDVIEKILFQHQIFNHDRFLLQMSVGSIPHEKVLRSIELFGTRVAPTVRQAIANSQ